MIFHENPLLADDSHEISYHIFSTFRKDVAKFVVCVVAIGTNPNFTAGLGKKNKKGIFLLSLMKII